MSINPYESSQASGERAVKKSRALSFTLVELLVVIVIIGILIALFLPAVRTSGEAARRASCSNNLKQIGLALHNYHDAYECFPPACTVDANGKPLHSWRTLILPYLEQKALYDSIDLTKPWDDPANEAALSAKVSPYQCPSSTAPTGHTTYLAVVGPNSCLQPGRPRPRAEITDNPSSTLIVIEVPPKHAVHWMSPTDASESLAVNSPAAEKPSHPGGTQALFLDGSIRFLSANTRPATLRAIISIAGKDDEAAQQQ